MRTYFVITAGFVLFVMSGALVCAQPREHLIYETPQEFFGQGDFDGDGRTDIIIVDKETGKLRLGYQMASGVISWVDNRPSGIKSISGFTIGKLLAANTDALAFTSPDANEITMVSVASTSSASRPVTVPFSSALGPNTLVAIDIGGAGKRSLQDLFVGSIRNSPDENVSVLLRNDGAEFPKLADAVLAGPAVHGNSLMVKPNEPKLLGYLLNEAKSDSFHLENLSSGKQVQVAAAGGLPQNSDYTVGSFGGAASHDFIFYKPGENKLIVKSLEQNASQFSAGNSFDLGEPVRRVMTIAEAAGQKLLVLFGEGEKAGVFEFDGKKAPSLKQSILATNELWTCGLAVEGGLILFSEPNNGKFSTRYYAYKAASDGYSFSAFGGLPPMTDNDNITIPDIHDQIVARTTVTNESQMKEYTNTIPGTQVAFAMVPIPGGEFTMGSPDSEANRKPDEGPQHKVKISPFWMGRCEVTWNEYELFMYPDEERRMRATEPTDAQSDKLADAVTHPSKPYVEMSFGMGKEGYPAIAMTQHGANKYCQWLSAKTGQFYRLPTEAEWEYACRAGTTTTFFFGEDASKIGEYAWYEQNSDFKYQKVGKKKPNPWGLYDIYGNVVEWVLDQYDPEFYKQPEATLPDPWNKAKQPYPHSVRGGSWDDAVVMCRSAARRGSDRSWKMQDPQLPKSVWFHSDAQWVGFRVVRPLKVPSAEMMQKYWKSGVERD